MKILKEIYKIIGITLDGFSYICYTTSKGFYYYIQLFFIMIKKIFKTENKILNKIIKHFEKRKQQPEFLLLMITYVVSICTIINILSCDNSIISIKKDNITNNDITNNDNQNNNDNKTINTNSKSSNLFIRYGSTKIEDVNLNYFKKINSETVAWLSVDGTNINYPIVKHSDNQYYLNHSFNNNYKGSGWVFMDYRNDSKLTDDNTIFYGHNLYNKTAFGSLSNIFTEDWINDSKKIIIVITEKKKYIYKIFSAYIIEPEAYYLQNKFLNKDNYRSFLDTLISRNTININETVSENDKIITLSTCSDDNKGRKVIHAKLVN